ncbi:MAG: fused MFS/spermidine synthase [Pseudomonadota bacterium]
MMRGSLPFIGTCFFLSGFSALVYQAAWANYLGLVFGTSHLAVATVLAAYMFGLAVGAFLAAKFVDRVRQPVRVYGLLEGAIAVSALLVPSLIAFSHYLYVSLFGGQPYPAESAGFFQPAYFLMSTFVVLLVPTVAMGATLPLLARCVVASDATIGSGIGMLYGLNTFGAVTGVLVSGFVLLPSLGLSRTTYIAVASNALIFLLILTRSRALQVTSIAAAQAAKPPTRHTMYILVSITGVISFSLEVYWTRLLSHVMGGTSYAFAVMLASFLSGIALGGYLGGRIAKGAEVAARYFGLAHLLMVACTLLTYLWVSHWVPDPGAAIPLRALYAFCALFPATLFLGATFPLAVRAVTASAGAAPACSGRVYAWNTLGAIVGAVLTGFILLPAVGFADMLRIVVGAGISVAFLAVARDAMGRTSVVRTGFLVLLTAVLLVPIPRPTAVLAAHVTSGTLEEVFYGVGRSSTVMLHREDGFFKLASNGLSESAMGSIGMPPFQLSQKWLAGLPSLARPDARDMLIVGLGGGIALQGAPPHIEEIDTIELEPRVLEANLAVADRRTFNPLGDARVRVILNDARNALALTGKRYDIVVSQPSHPWTGGASHLYTREFLALAKQRMQPGGVFLQWINSQFIDLEMLRAMAATLQSEFANVELYQPERQVLMFLASDNPISLWDGAGNARRALEENREHYLGLGMRAPEDALVMLTFDTAGVRELAAHGRTNTDDENLLAYRARPRRDGVTADSLIEAYPELDPLLRSSSPVHAGPDYWSLPYIAERLLQSNFIQRVNRMARAATDPSMARVIDGLGMEYTGDLEGGEAAFWEALQLNAGNRDAGLGLLRMHLGDFAARRLAPEIASLANRLTGPSRAALEGWVFGASGNFDQLRSLDARLAAVDPRSQLYPVAVKLRVDWRLWFARSENNRDLALEGMALLDTLLASYWNADLYLLRAACADAALVQEAMVESYAAAISQVKSEMKRSVGAADPSLKQRLDFSVAALRNAAEDYRGSPGKQTRIEEILASF